MNDVGWNNVNIELLESVNCENKKELYEKEREWVLKLKPTLNQQIPSNGDYKEQSKLYREKNKEKLRGNKKQYYQDNKETINIDRKKKYREDPEEKKKNNDRATKWCQDNKEKRKAYMKAYHAKHKNDEKSVATKERLAKHVDKMKAKSKIRVNCPICGKELAKGSLNAHRKTIHA